MKTAKTFSFLLSALFCFSQEEGEWDSYLADYEGKLGSTLLDMSLIRVAPLKTSHSYWLLRKQAELYNGRYDGWETLVIK